MSWEESYIDRVVRGTAFDLEKVKNLSNNIVESLNRKGQGKLSRKIEWDDNNTIIFPDCKINFYLDNNYLIFQKLERQTDNRLDSLVIVDTGRTYVINRSSERVGSEASLDKTVDFALEFLLTRSTNLNL